MLEISEADVASRLERDNPWWQEPTACLAFQRTLPRRDYFSPFARLAREIFKARNVVQALSHEHIDAGGGVFAS